MSIYLETKVIVFIQLPSLIINEWEASHGGKNTQQQSNLSELSEYLLTQKRNQKTDLHLFYVEKKKAFGEQTPVPNLSIIIKLTVQGRENQ